MRYLTMQEIREEGFLQEMNRRFFHPLGLAAEVQWDPENQNDPAFLRVQDHRAIDMEGVYFLWDNIPQGSIDGIRQKNANVNRLEDERRPERERLFDGENIQQLP